MLEMGYIKVYVALDIGVNIYAGAVEYEGEDAIDHLEVGNELWVKLIDGSDRAQIFGMDDEASIRYINLVDIIATLKPEEMEELPTRELNITSNIDGYEVVSAGTRVLFKTELINFLEEDNYTVQWKYSVDGEEFIDIEEANDLEYEYTITMDNADYLWKVSIVLIAPVEE